MRLAPLADFDPAAAVEAAVRAHMDAALREIDPAAAERQARLETALAAQAGRIDALERFDMSQAVLEAFAARAASAPDDTAARLAALEAADPAEAVQAEVRAGVERAMGPAMARIAALRAEVETAVETRLTPLLSRLSALEEERMVLRRTVDLAAPSAVAGLQVEVGVLVDRHSALASVDAQPAPGAAKPRVTMLSSTKI